MMLPPGPPCQDDLPHPLAGRHRVPPLLPGHPHQPRTTLRRLRRQDPAECAFGLSLTVGRVVRFYSPLALTSFLSFFINPLTTFFLARGRMPLESLAILPVIVGLAFVFRTAGIAMQEVVIALVGDAGENRRVLRRFTLRVGAASTAGALPIGPALTAGYAAGVVVLAARSCIIHPTA